MEVTVEAILGKKVHLESRHGKPCLEKEIADTAANCPKNQNIIAVMLLNLYVFQFSCSSLLNPLKPDCVKLLLTALSKDLGKTARIRTFFAILSWEKIPRWN